MKNDYFSKPKFQEDEKMIPNATYKNLEIIFKKIVNKLSEGVLITDSENIIYINDICLKQFGISPNLELPIKLQEFHPLIFQKITYSKPLAESQTVFQFNINEKKFRGNLSSIEIDNALYNILTTIHIENSSFEDVAIKNEIINKLPFIYMETDAQGIIKICNHKCYEILDFEKDIAFSEVKLHDIVQNSYQSQIDWIFSNTHHVEHDQNIEIKIKVKNGTVYVYRMFFNYLYTNETFKGLKCIFVDISENKRIEKKFRHNQQRLRKILDLTPQMIFLKDISGKILMANRAFAEFYNTSTKELVYENISRFHENKKELEQILFEDKQVIETQKSFDWEEMEMTPTGGKPQIFKVAKVPYQDKESEEIYSLGIAQNITQQQLAETEKHEANEKYRLLVEEGSDGILILKDNKIVFANQQAAKIAGKNSEEIIGYPLACFVPKKQLDFVLEKYKNNILNKIYGDHYNLKIPKQEGGFIYLEVTFNSINYFGSKSRIVFVRDITRRRLAEKQSEKDRKLLEQAQKIAHLGTWEWDMVKNKLFVSDEINTILDVDSDPDSLRDISWIVNFIPITERKKIFRGFLDAEKTGLRYEIDFPAITQTGERKIIHSQSMVYKDSTGQTTSLIGTWLDITDRIKIEQNLKVAKQKAEESDKLKSAFLANMSHEIRTPMNAVLGFASLLKREDVDEITRLEYIDHILQSGENLIKLINDIVDVSKIESNQLEIEKCPVRINELIEQVFNRYEELLLLKNHLDIKLHYEAAMPNPDFTIITDPYRLQQILSNLINNAIKFTPTGEIKFGYTIANSELQFFVKDDGVGIPDDKREAIFRRFSKLEDPDRINKNGAGLGLSISKSLVDLLGGRIWIEKKEIGSCFCFTLPLEICKPPKKDLEFIDNNEINFNIDLKGKTILIAEDEMLNFKLLETILKKTGANILWAEDGIEAVQKTLNNKIDLIFMDIKMPEMDGYEATKQIKRINSSIPIIAQTAFAFSNERKYILQSGCDLYMTKPIIQKDLFKALKMFFATHKPVQ